MKLQGVLIKRCKKGRQRLAFFKAGLSAIFLLCCAEGMADAYRWVDDQGNVHYADQVPPEEAKHPRAKLNREGKSVELIEGAKTREQVERDKRLKQLREEELRILAAQKDRDQSLLRTYHSEEEMQEVLQSKLDTIEATRKVTESNRQHQEELLQSQVQRAAEIELTGQEVPKTLAESIEATRRQIANLLEQNRSLENSKAEIVASFAKDRERFQSVEALRSNQQLYSLEWRVQKPTADVGIISAVSCPPQICAQAWTLAKQYVQVKTGKPLVTETETVLQTASPREQSDLALLVVRIKGKTEDTLFLDTSCQSSSIGDELCSGDLVRQIRTGFAPYIEQGLKAAGH